MSDVVAMYFKYCSLFERFFDMMDILVKFYLQYDMLGVLSSHTSICLQMVN